MSATKIAASRKSAKTKQDAFKVISTMHAVRHSIDKFKGSETNSKYVFIQGLLELLWTVYSKVSIKRPVLLNVLV